MTVVYNFYVVLCCNIETKEFRDVCQHCWRRLCLHIFSLCAALAATHSPTPLFCRYKQSMPTLPRFCACQASDSGQYCKHDKALSCLQDRKSTRLNSSHANISYAV